MSDWNKETLGYKAARRGEVELRPTSKGKRQPRKWRVIGVSMGREYVAHRAASHAACEQWIAKQRQSYYVYRTAPVALRAEASARAAQYAQAYRIVGPAEPQ